MKPLGRKWICVVLILLLCNNVIIHSQRDKDSSTILFGLILHEGVDDFLEDFMEAQESVKDAVRRLRERGRVTNVEYRVERANFNDSFGLMKKVCSMLSMGVFSLIVHGPATSYEVINSLADKMNMPTFFPTGSGNSPSFSNSYVFNMMPSYTDAIVDLIHFFRWDIVYYLFDSKEGLIRLQDLYKASGGNDFRFTIRPRRISNISDCYDLLRALDRQNSFSFIGLDRFRQPVRIILDLSSRKAYNLTLEQIINVGMNRESYHYILGGLGIYDDKEHLKSFEYGGVNITGFTVIDKEKYRQIRKPDNYNRRSMKYKDALMRDTINFIAKGYARLKREYDNLGRRQRIMRNGDMSGLNCSGRPWDLGEEVDKMYKSISDNGFTGTVNFNAHGLRDAYTLEVHQLEYRKPLRKIGTWSPKGPTLKDRFQTNLTYPNDTGHGEVWTNRTLRIVTILEPPFVQLVAKNENGEQVGKMINGSRYEGYCIDLAEKVEKRYKMMFEREFKTEIHLVKDGQFGSLNTLNGKWNGMIGELIYGDADLAIASLTINKERERAVDFTKPFMNMGVSIMIKKPDREKPGVFSFMYPLSNKVWLCVMVAFLAVSFVLFFVGRWSPYEWQTISSPKEESTTNAFTFSNTLWFALGALMQQGSDIFPRSFSGRVVGSAWWFFTLILISSYTANLAAFLTIERLLTPIKSADDLVDQSEIAYGTYRGGATQRFFEESQVTIFKRMWKYMKRNWNSVMMESNNQGIEKVRSSKGKYAFLCESPLNEYQSQKRPCDTMKVGDNLDSKGYGIATPLHSPLRKDLNLVVLDLREQGELHKLLQRWWYDKGECGTSDSSDSIKSALTLSNVSGIFHILIGGLVLSMIVALLEFLIIRKRKQQKQQSYKPTTVKIVKKDPLEALKAAGYTEQENSGYTYSNPDYMRSFDANNSSPRTAASHTAI